jgi:hypothetical protein
MHCAICMHSVTGPTWSMLLSLHFLGGMLSFDAVLQIMQNVDKFIINVFTLSMQHVW